MAPARQRFQQAPGRTHYRFSLQPALPALDGQVVRIE